MACQYTQRTQSMEVNAESVAFVSGKMMTDMTWVFVGMSNEHSVYNIMLRLPAALYRKYFISH